MACRATDWTGWPDSDQAITPQSRDAQPSNVATIVRPFAMVFAFPILSLSSTGAGARWSEESRARLQVATGYFFAGVFAVVDALVEGAVDAAAVFGAFFACLA
jgi:hypothetical protein